MTGRATRTAVTAGLAAALLASCVDPGSSGVSTIAPEEVPYDLLDPAPAPGPAAGTTLSSEDADVPDGELDLPLYLIGPEGALLPSPTSVDPGTPGEVASRLLDRLEAGPGEAERGAGLSTALGPDLALRVEGVDGDGVVEVEVGGTTTRAVDQVPLAIGQIVLTLTSAPGVTAVRVVSEGRPVPLPLPGGRLTTGTVTADDYRPLTVP